MSFRSPIISDSGKSVENRNINRHSEKEVLPKEQTKGFIPQLQAARSKTNLCTNSTNLQVSMNKIGSVSNCTNSVNPTNKQSIIITQNNNLDTIQTDKKKLHNSLPKIMEKNSINFSEDKYGQTDLEIKKSNMLKEKIKSNELSSNGKKDDKVKEIKDLCKDRERTNSNNNNHQTKPQSSIGNYSNNINQIKNKKEEISSENKRKFFYIYF